MMAIPQDPVPLGEPDWSVGTVLPSLPVRPTRAHLFMFSAATWNRHHVHYDREAAIREGLPDVVVHRGLVGNYLVRLVTDWLAQHGGSLETISWRMLQSAVPDAILICRAEVTKLEKTDTEMVATCRVEAVDEADNVIASGQAVVRRSRGPR